MTDNKEFDFKEIASLDEQIEVLFSCKPLPESQIKILCDKVSQRAVPLCLSWPQHVSNSRKLAAPFAESVAHLRAFEVRRAKMGGHFHTKRTSPNHFLLPNSLGKRNPCERAERAERDRPRDHLRRHPRPVPRLA